MRTPSIRQFEALIAVIETGTVIGAARRLRISQPAASKLIRDLELDTGLKLFERESGRLVATGRGMRLYEEVDRVFGGVNQLARAVEAIRREDRGRISVGVMPGLSGPFMRRAMEDFYADHPDVHVTMEARSSQYLAEAILLRRLDLAVIVAGFEHPSLEAETLRGGSMMCALPKEHPLTQRDRIGSGDLVDEPFISFAENSTTRRQLDPVLEAAGVRLNVAIEANTAANLGEFVAAGFGITVALPLLMEPVSDRIEMRPFIPELIEGLTILRPRRARNSALTARFAEAVHNAAASQPRV